MMLAATLPSMAQDTVFCTFDRDDGIYYWPYLDWQVCNPNAEDGFFRYYEIRPGRSLLSGYKLDDTTRLVVYGVAVTAPDSAFSRIGKLPGTCAIVLKDSVSGGYFFADSVCHYQAVRYFRTEGYLKGYLGCSDTVGEMTSLCAEFYFDNPIEIRPNTTFYTVWIPSFESPYTPLYYGCYFFCLDSTLPYYSSEADIIIWYCSNGVFEALPYYTATRLYQIPIVAPPAFDTVPHSPQASRPEVRYLDTVYAQLSWEPTEGSTAYQLMVTMPDGSEMVRNCLSTTYYLYDLEQGGHYTAKVRAQMHHRCYYHDTVFFGEWSDTVGFTVPTNEPVGIAPTGNSVGEVLLRPNPVHSLLTVEHPSMEQAVIEVLNTSGLCVMKVSVRECETVLDVSTLPKGSYLLRLYSGGHMAARTFVVE